MEKITTRGKCHFCQEVLAKNVITRHLAKCPERTKWNQQEEADNAKAKSAKPGKLFHLLVEGRYNPQYWMHIELSAGSTLATLDNFLRGVWVECCGHLSRFEIAGTSYASYVDSEFGDRSMNVQLEKVLSPEQTFSYEYDYGTTTDLRLKVIAERAAVLKRNTAIHVMARNEAPVIPCDVCGKPAVEVCAQCIDEDRGWLCESCADEHECGEEMLLPVVNSPRVGMCGYTG